MGTTSAMFRLDATDVEKLQKEAEKNGISTNALLSVILKSYFEWDEMATQVGYIPMHKYSVMALLDYIQDSDLKQVAANSADKFIDKLPIMAAKSDLDSYLTLTKIRLQKSGFAFREFTEEDGSTSLMVVHGMGHKWSVFFASRVERIVSRLGYKPEIDIKDDSWIIRITPKLAKQIKHVEVL